MNSNDSRITPQTGLTSLTRVTRVTRVTMLRIPFPEENSRRAALISLVIHVLALLLVLFGARLFPQAVVQLGGGPGGGLGGEDITTVGVVDQLSGGAGMVKPSLIAQPPVLEKTPEPPTPPSEAVALPDTVVQPKPEPKPAKPASVPAKKEPKPKPRPDGNIIPTEARPGSGGIASKSAASGRGRGSGSGGISIGTGDDGLGDSWYAQIVEKRLSAEWLRPPAGIQVDMTYSFYIAANGRIYDVKMEKSSGNAQIDMTGRRAILNSNPLSAPPREFRGKAIQFVARFVHPQEAAGP